VIGVALVVLAALLVATVLTWALGPAAEERRPPVIRPEVQARIDATLPRSQEQERWLANREDLRQ
jgi:hypothetical protein